LARKPRLFVADVPYHVIQRGNNKGVIFFSEQDYRFFLETLQEGKEKYPCSIYSYCLLTNHFHLLIEPKEKEGVSLLMKFLGVKYVSYINKFHNRTGTLWEGRFKCSLIDRETYFLSCLRYIEMNPVRAGIVKAPELYHWSSYRFRAFGEGNRVLDSDAWYDGLENNPERRQLLYRNLFQAPSPDLTDRLIREMTNKNSMVGEPGFRRGQTPP